jgi:hypothetical protein
MFFVSGCDCGRDLPQLLQNLLFPGFSAPHTEHFNEIHLNKKHLFADDKRFAKVIAVFFEIFPAPQPVNHALSVTSGGLGFPHVSYS